MRVMVVIIARYQIITHVSVPGGSFQVSASVVASFRLARRFDEVGFSDIVKVRNRVMELLARGETYRNTPEHIKQAVTSALTENKTRYAPSSGISELRHAIAYKLQEKNNIDASHEDVIVVNGGM